MRPSSTVRRVSVRADNHSCVARTCQVSLECSHLIDYKRNTALWGCRSWNCKRVGRCVLFLVHAGDSACFKFLAVTCSSSSLRNKSDIITCSCVHHGAVQCCCVLSGLNLADIGSFVTGYWIFFFASRHVNMSALLWLNVETLKRAPTSFFGRRVRCSTHGCSFVRLHYILYHSNHTYTPCILRYILYHAHSNHSNHTYTPCIIFLQ